jgi:hypothetical protein
MNVVNGVEGRRVEGQDAVNISQLNSYSSSNEGLETGALIRLGMMVSFHVEADQVGMGFWAPSLFGEASLGLRAWEGGARHWR